MVSFRGQNLLKPRPDWSPLGVKFKISDEHPRLFRMGVPPPGVDGSSCDSEAGFAFSVFVTSEISFSEKIGSVIVYYSIFSFN